MNRTDIAEAIVRVTARPESDLDDPRTWTWVDSSVWTDRMLAALGNGVRGGRWHSLIDHTRWPNAFFAKQGLFTMTEAYVLASQSR